MAHALALMVSSTGFAPEEILRRFIVTGCAVALIAAGQSLPF